MKTFFNREPVLCIAAFLAVLSMCANPPSLAYSDYIDVRVLCLLFVWLPFFSSMLITNDVALITFVPFTILILEMIGQKRQMIWMIVLQTAAANLGSMATPVGNPQNLFLYGAFRIPAGQFFALLLPLTVLSLAALSAAALFSGHETICIGFPEKQGLGNRKQLAVCAVLFFLCLLSVFHVLHYGVLTVLAVIGVGICSPRLLAGTNIGGLGTPVASLASLISLKFYMKTEGARPWEYIKVFTVVNGVGLAVLTGCYVWLLS